MRISALQAKTSVIAFVGHKYQKENDTWDQF